MWRQGCLDWETYLDQPNEFSIGSASRELFRSTLLRSQDALAAGNHQFFAKKLTISETWRAFPEFRDTCGYLDIETDGGRNGAAVTLVGVYDGVEFHAYLKGDNLENFRDAASNYSMWVTFFGTGFDIPVLQKRFKGVPFDHLHFDLCPALRKVGIKGGLKRIEKSFGISRSSEVDGLTGFDAVRLWRLAQRGDDSARELLIDYNKADCVNLEPLAEEAYGRLRTETFEAHAFGDSQGELPQGDDADVIDDLETEAMP